MFSKPWMFVDLLMEHRLKDGIFRNLAHACQDELPITHEAPQIIAFHRDVQQITGVKHVPL